MPFSGPCRIDQFQCKNGGQCKIEFSIYDSRCSGLCMPLEWKCDGTEGCTDGSDESRDTCDGKFICQVAQIKLCERFIQALLCSLVYHTLTRGGGSHQWRGQTLWWQEIVTNYHGFSSDPSSCLRAENTLIQASIGC